MTAVESVIELPGLRDRPEILLGGRWVAATGVESAVVDPATEDVVAIITQGSAADVERAVAAARAAFEDGPWRTWTPEQRATVIDAIADGLEARIDELTRIGTYESGLPAPFSRFSQSSAIGFFRYYAQQARDYRFRVDRTRPDGGTTRVLAEPVGVVAAIAPWNGALPTAGLKLGPALAAGCTAVLKPPVETPLTSYVLADVVAELVESGALPEGVISIVAAGPEASQALVADPDVDKISFTGSTVVGRQIMAAAAQRIARVTLELGGKSAAIILDDAPLDEVLPTLVLGGCGNTGQICFGLTRILVSEHRHDEVVAALKQAMESLPVGSGHEPGSLIGPLSIAKQVDRVQGYIDGAVQDGASIVTGGGRPAGFDKGYFISPTLLDDVRNDMRVAQEEVFGPVISVITYTDVEDAIAIANDSIYGLSGSVYTADAERGYEIARRIRTGTISVNAAVFDATVPFGGFKQSGTGREGGHEGLEGFLEFKSVHMPASR